MRAYYAHISGYLKSQIFRLLIILSIISSSAMAHSLTFQKPHGREVWINGRVEIATCTGRNLGSDLSLEFFSDVGTNWISFGEVPSGPNKGNAAAGVPNTSASNAILRIADIANTSANDITNAHFAVYIPSMFIWEPSANSTVFANSLIQV